MTGTRTGCCPPLVTPLCTVLYRYKLVELTESAAPPYVASHPSLERRSYWTVGGTSPDQRRVPRISSSIGMSPTSLRPHPRNLELVAVVHQGIARETTLELLPSAPLRPVVFCYASEAPLAIIARRARPKQTSGAVVPSMNFLNNKYRSLCSTTLL